MLLESKLCLQEQCSSLIESILLKFLILLCTHQVIQGSPSSFITATGFSSWNTRRFWHHGLVLLVRKKAVLLTSIHSHQLRVPKSGLQCCRQQHAAGIFLTSSQSHCLHLSRSLLLLLLLLSWCRAPHQKGDSVLLPQSAAQPMATAAETVTR